MLKLLLGKDKVIVLFIVNLAVILGGVNFVVCFICWGLMVMLVMLKL